MNKEYGVIRKTKKMAPRYLVLSPDGEHLGIDIGAYYPIQFETRAEAELWYSELGVIDCQYGGWWAVHHDFDLVTSEGFVLQHATEAGAISWLGALTVEKADVLVLA
jgi:hypothetical protein